MNTARGALRLAAVVSALWLTVAHASPDRAIHRRVLLLGIDSTSTWSVAMELTQPGSYYVRTDSTFFERADFEGRRIQRELLRAVAHSDTGGVGKWVYSESSVEGPDPVALLRDRGIATAFPADIEPCRLSWSADHVSILCYGDSTVIVHPGEFGTPSIWGEPEKMRLLSVFKTRAYLFLLIAFGEPGFDTDYVEQMVPVRRDRIGL